MGAAMSTLIVMMLELCSSLDLVCSCHLPIQMQWKNVFKISYNF